MTHKDLEVWKKSMDLVTSLYRITSHFPKSEMYGLTSQIRRSAVSVPSNISEGAARNHTKEFIQFLYISLFSLSELETQMIISFNLEFVTNETFKQVNDLLIPIRIMLLGLIRSLQK
jgi:four helix bundle protein